MANIRAGRKSGFIMRSGVMRRESLWVRVNETDTGLAAASTAAISNSANAALLALRPFTVVRTRGYLSVRTDQEVASEDYHVAFAAAVVSDQAVAIGVTAVPTPITDGGSDLFWMYEDIQDAVNVQSGVGVDFGIATGRTFDSKAMRKVEDGQDIVFVKEAGTLSTGLICFTAARLLIKVH